MRPEALPLAGRTILVTGGGHRVGGAICRHLSQLGARVLIHYNTSWEAARALAESLAFDPRLFQADLSSPQGAERLFSACVAADAVPDGLVHAAASFLKCSLPETSAAQWDEVFALNLRALFLLSQEFSRHRSDSGGDIIAIGDSGGLELWTGYFAHSVAKAATIPLVKALAKSLAPKFRVNGVIPGPVLPPEGTTQEDLIALREQTLLKRIGRPLDVARAVEFLLISEFITGSWIEVTGGANLWRGNSKAARRTTDSENEETD